jgi:hypothetical protein
MTVIYKSTRCAQQKLYPEGVMPSGVGDVCPVRAGEITTGQDFRGHCSASSSIQVQSYSFGDHKQGSNGHSPRAGHKLGLALADGEVCHSVRLCSHGGSGLHPVTIFSGFLQIYF